VRTEDTEAIAERVARAAAPGTIIAFRGGLGAGKTVFARGLARGLGIQEAITSPTYTIVNEYDGLMPFFHIDAYRLRSAEEFELLDSARYLYGDGLCAIEWSERIEDALPDNVVSIAIVPEEDGSRTISISGESIERVFA
jgi:tRNA threonylcarbamoyladenosine biosynthesis protein TsaE